MMATLICIAIRSVNSDRSRDAARVSVRVAVRIGLRSMLAVTLVALAITSVGLTSHRTMASDEGAPFVAGFDRFARHGDLEQLAAGRLLLAELSCVSCHARAGDESSLQTKGGPKLDGVALRLRQEWLEAYIADPHATKPESTMPDVLGDRSEAERKAIAKSLAAFLSTQRKPPAEVKGSGLLPVPHEFWNKGDAARGKVLYHSIGCVACHEPDREHAVAPKSTSLDQLLEDLDDDELAELGLTAAAREVRSVPFSDLSAKYSAYGLTHFLLDPAQSRPTSRMPSLKLAPVEAADIASYLLKLQAAASAASIADPADVAKGKQLFVELNCVQCHTAGGLHLRELAEPLAKPLAELNANAARHCLSNQPASPVRYRLDDPQIEALREAIAAEKKPTQISSHSQLEQYLLTFNCYACHERNARGGVARFRRDYFETVSKVDLGDEGRLPPPLTNVGLKLQTAWLENVLLGKKADIRPHMQIRMPQFHSELSNRLPDLFLASDKADRLKADRLNAGATSERTQPLVQANLQAADMIDAGRQLMDVGCVQCHAFEGSTLPGVIGVDVRGINNRVRPEWFREFILNPGALKARTRMPSFFPDGKSQRPDLLNGDVDQQIAAVWAYLSAKRDAELPNKIKEARSQNYELRPTEKPVVLRTFMNEAGTHAIAVGFSQRIHYAFDAESVQLAVGWQGKFLDAQGTWFVRLAPPASPLGEKIIAFPNSPPFAYLSNPTEAWPTTLTIDDSTKYNFTGYRLDSTGVPTFLYQFSNNQLGKIEVEDRIEPIVVEESASLRRTLTLKAKPPATQTNTNPSTQPTPNQPINGKNRVWLLAATGKKLTQLTPQSVQNEAGLHTTIKDLMGQVRLSAGREEWLVPIEFEKSFTVELQYQW